MVDFDDVGALLTDDRRQFGKPILVRPPSAAAEHILNALDCGADGVILPHIRTAEEAEEAVKACQYVRGGRGYAGSSRAAAYTTKGMASHRADAAEVIVIAQLEDVEGVDNIEAIARVPGDTILISQCGQYIVLVSNGALFSSYHPLRRASCNPMRQSLSASVLLRS